jgi:hypothetical protein
MTDITTELGADEAPPTIEEMGTAPPLPEDLSELHMSTMMMVHDVLVVMMIHNIKHDQAALNRDCAEKLIAVRAEVNRRIAEHMKSREAAEQVPEGVTIQ